MNRLPLEAELAAVFENVRRRQGGEVATYIPALAKADPNWFGVSLMTVDGASYSLGDSEEPFTIQSVSKPFALLMYERMGLILLELRSYDGISVFGHMDLDRRSGSLGHRSQCTEAVSHHTMQWSVSYWLYAAIHCSKHTLTRRCLHRIHPLRDLG